MAGAGNKVRGQPVAYEHLSWAAKTDVGRKRKNNEDSNVCLPQSGVFCVADGMGGMAAGDVASGIVVGTIKEHFDSEPRPMSASEKARKAVAALSIANDRIHEAARARGLQTVGSTVVLAAFDGRNPARLTIVHAGDSRCYRFREGKLLQLTTDHSVAEAVGIDEKKLSAMFRGVVTRAIGTVEEIEPEKTNMQIQAGDVYLICSDGLTRMVPDAGIRKILTDLAGQPLQQRADALVDAANAAGGDDNVTSLLIEVTQWPPEAVLETGPAEETGSSTSVEPSEDKDTAAEITPLSQVGIPLGDIPKQDAAAGEPVPAQGAEEAASATPPATSSRVKIALIVLGVLAAIGALAFYIVNERKKAEQYRQDSGTPVAVDGPGATSAAPAVVEAPEVRATFEVVDGGKRFVVLVKGRPPSVPLTDGSWDVVKAHRAAFDEWRKTTSGEATKDVDGWIRVWDELCEPASSAQRMAAYRARAGLLQRLAAAMPQVSLTVPEPAADDPRAIWKAYAAMQSTVSYGLASFREQNMEALSFPSPEDRIRLREIESLSGMKLKAETAKLMEQLSDEVRPLRVSPLLNAEMYAPAWKPENAEALARGVTNWQALALASTRAVAQEIKEAGDIPEIPGRPQRRVARTEFLGSLSAESTVNWIQAVRKAAASDPVSFEQLADGFREKVRRSEDAAQAILNYRAYLYCVQRAWILRRDLGGGTPVN